MTSFAAKESASLVARWCKLLGCSRHCSRPGTLLSPCQTMSRGFAATQPTFQGIRMTKVMLVASPKRVMKPESVGFVSSRHPWQAFEKMMACISTQSVVLKVFMTSWNPWPTGCTTRLLVIQRRGPCEAFLESFGSLFFVNPLQGLSNRRRRSREPLSQAQAAQDKPNTAFFANPLLGLANRGRGSRELFSEVFSSGGVFFLQQPYQD